MFRQKYYDEIIKLFQLYKQKMYYIAYAILGDSFQAEDAVMNAFLKLLEHHYEVDDPESDKSKHLVISVTKSAAIDLYRRNRREMEIINLSDDPEILRNHDDEITEFNDLNEVESMIDELPEKYREVMVERFINNLSTVDTAKKLNISEDAVRKRQQRTIKMLKDKFAQ